MNVISRETPPAPIGESHLLALASLEHTHMHMGADVHEIQKCVRALGAGGVTGICELSQCGCWEPNLGPLESRMCSLTATFLAFQRVCTVCRLTY